MPDSQPKIRVMVVDDHALLRGGVASVLRGDPGFEVVGEAASGTEAVALAQRVVPDVVLMDVNMPGGNGLEATRLIKESLPQTRIVMLTVSEEDHDLFEAVRSGAQGYLLKKIEPQALLETLRGVMQGETPISGAVAGKILGELSRLREGRAAPEAQLTPREEEVLEQVAHGKSNKEIGSLLGVAENTVKNHLKNILEKLQLENRVQAATFALRRGLGKTPPKTS